MHEILVTAHVGRSLLQSAAHFKTDRAVLWEYVANSLQYVDPGVKPQVLVTIDEKKKVMRVTDNGRGMTFQELQHFFQMHGENIERAAGRPGRGMFGTGKSAAFGIANTLKVTTVRAGKKNAVALGRRDVEAMAGGAPIPVRILIQDQKTGEPNGTMIEILDINLKKIDRTGVVKFIERHLSHFPRDVEVFVDHHLCEFKEPEVAEEYTFLPTGEDARLLGSPELVIRVSKGPLPEELRGIQIFSHGNWHSTTLAGCDGKMSEFLLGEIEVPALEEYKGAIAPFDNTRSGELNPNNEIVAALYRFLGPNIDQVRRKLLARQREQAKSEEAKKLAEQAAKISEVLSEDFSNFKTQLSKAALVARGRDVGRSFAQMAGDEEDEGQPWSEGGEDLASPVRPEDKSEATNKPPTQAGGEPPEFQEPVTKDTDGTTTGRPRAGEGKKRAPRGGLSIKYLNLGADEPRGKYGLAERTITINLDHPQVEAAHSLGGVDEPAFIRLTVEIAISEYAIALATELIDTYSFSDEAVFDIHETVDRVSRQFVSFYEGK